MTPANLSLPPGPGDAIIQTAAGWLHFADPVQVITAAYPHEVLPALQAVETAVNQHRLYAAGFISYEAAAAFHLATHPPADLPLLWFGLYEPPTLVTDLANGKETAAYQLSEWMPSLDRATYDVAISRIKDHIAAGDTYQVNYTFHLRAAFSGEPWALFTDLAAAQQAAYAAYVDTGEVAICSASPELFFHLDGDRLQSKPMKGTAVRGLTPAQDRQQMAWLHASEKNRAENVMIVDMIRNDMGRVAAVGSVQVPHLFEVERYPTVLQMTSTVTAHTTASLVDIMAAMFPCASITGAPKVRTMQLIRCLEPEPRGVYTGAIGYLAPGRQAQFNVAIRTVVIDRARSTADYGVGSGIVWDSVAEEEYEECRVKARVLGQKRPSFCLLESLLWTPEAGYTLLEAHLTRLADSAAYFNRPLDRTAVIERLLAFSRELTGPTKVRLLLEQTGAIAVEGEPLASSVLSEPLRAGLAAQPVDSGNLWLYHKTTHRAVYESARASRPECDDVILWNERGEITEASSANVVVELDGALWTPPVTCGLLAGTLRGALLQDGRIRERVITLGDLERSPRLYLINSVRGWRPAVLMH